MAYYRSPTVVTAQTHLAQYNVSMQEAKQFIMSSMKNLSLIYTTCLQFGVWSLEFGVNNDMIAEVLGGGITGDVVQNYLIDHGINGGALGRNFELSAQWLKGKDVYQVEDFLFPCETENTYFTQWHLNEDATSIVIDRAYNTPGQPSVDVGATAHTHFHNNVMIVTTNVPGDNIVDNIKEYTVFTGHITPTGIGEYFYVRDTQGKVEFDFVGLTTNLTIAQNSMSTPFTEYPANTQLDTFNAIGQGRALAVMLLGQISGEDATDYFLW